MITLSALVLPDRHPISAFLAEVREAEAAGVHAVWTYDHLTWPLLKDNPWYGFVPLLAAAAGVTTRVRLGAQVATPNYRHPVPFAKELMTLDQLSGGRIDLGVGAGTEGPDAAVLGDPPLTLRKRMDRFIQPTCLHVKTNDGQDIAIKFFLFFNFKRLFKNSSLCPFSILLNTV